MSTIAKAETRSSPLLMALLACFGLVVACGITPTDATSPSKLQPTAPRLAVQVGDYLKVYLSSHQDDWQLYMGDRVSTGLQTVPNVVFIYTTAGDGGDAPSFWQPREQAAQAAVDALTPAGTWSCASQVVNGHSILRCAKGGAVSYNMRLPDGGNGSGFLGRGSLAMLRDGAQASLTAIDGSATYSSWADLTNTIRAIIDLEGAGQAAPYVDVHSPDYDRTLNPRDHSDNYATGDLLHDAAATRSWNISWYVDYDISNRAINLTQAAHDIKRLAFYAYDNYMGSRGLGREQYDQLYQDWLWRTYYRSTVSTPPLPPALQQACRRLRSPRRAST